MLQSEVYVYKGDGEGQENLVGVLRDLSKGAAKKRVLKPQPKLDGERYYIIVTGIKLVLFLKSAQFY